MLHKTIINEDTMLVATRNNTDGKWCGYIADLPTGKQAPISWTDTEMQAVVTLAEGVMENDDIERDGHSSAWDTVQEQLYQIASPLFKELPSELRMIP